MDDNTPGSNHRGWKMNSLGNLLQWTFEEGNNEESVEEMNSVDIPQRINFLSSSSCASGDIFSQDSRRSSRSGNMASKIVPLAFSPHYVYDVNDNENDEDDEDEEDNDPVHAVSAAPARLDKSISVAEHAIQGLRFISQATHDKDLSELWMEVESRFHRLCSLDGLLARFDFAECIGMRESKEFALELFDALRRGQFASCCYSFISKEELRHYWNRITERSFEARIRIFFDLCDKDSDGRITEAEVKEVILLSASANKLSILHEQAEEYAALIMEELDRDNHGYIGLSELETLFKEAFGSESQQGHSQSFLPARKKQSWDHALSKTLVLVRSNWKRAWIVALWLLICVLLFVWKFLQYKNRSSFQIMGYCVCTAKGAAETLKFNMALILLPVCRNTMTWLRSTALSAIVPFNDNINFHKMIAGGIVIGVILHGGTHLACDFPRIVNSNLYTYEATIGTDFDERKPSYKDILMTTEGITGISIVVLMSIAFLLATRLSRRNLVTLPWPFHRLTGFNAFWYSHHLFILVYILLIIHSLFLFLEHNWLKKTTWMYLAFPVLLYIAERTLRALRARKYGVKILKATTYPGSVLSLRMSKPKGFQYKSGMYIYIQCPEISPFEWHPFSLTSAPGDDHLSVHIRTLGDWTDEITSLFELALDVAGRGHACASLEPKTDDALHRFSKIYIDGPYGAAAQDYSKYDVMLLIGLGIGATPFISILKDIVNKETNPGMMPDEESGRCSGPSRAYFYWVTREQSSFEWFRSIMNEVAQLDSKEIIEMHNYLTSVYEEGDARSALITMVQTLHHAKRGFDIVSGTPVRTHFARPNWRKVFSRISERHEGSTIGVFYCGTGALAKELNMLCRKYTRRSKANFVFHKEHY